MALYVESGEDELAERTIESRASQLPSFVERLGDEGIDDVNEVRARTVHEHESHIEERLASSTVVLHLCTVRQSDQFRESIG